MNTEYRILTWYELEYIDQLLMDLGLTDKVNHYQFCELARRACYVYSKSPNCSIDEVLTAIKQFIITPFGEKTLRELI